MMKKIALLFLASIALAGGVLGCGASPTPAPAPTHTPVPVPTDTTTPPPTATPLPTPTPTPTPLPLQAPDSEGVTLHTVCLEVEQSYPEIENKTPERIADAAQRVLSGLGLLVVAPGTPCDATLTVALTGKALGAEYSGGEKYCYSGARMGGQMALALPERAPLTLPIEGELPSPFAISFCPEEPAHAPFAKAWSQALLGGLAELWGPQVFIQALTDESVRMGEAAAHALAEIGPQAVDAVPALLQALMNEEEDSGRRQAASDALGAIGSEAVPALVQALADEDERVRNAAARALKDVGPQAVDAVPALIQALGDPDDDVSMAAASALGDVGPEAIPMLIEALGNRDAPARRGAILALGWIGPEAKEAAPLIIQALEGDAEWLVRSSAAHALGSMQPDASEAIPALIQALADESEYVRAAAADALGDFESQAGDAIPALIEALADEHAGTRSSAARALRDITGQDLGEDLDRWQQWRDQQQE
jgi:HEAT repeat protein